MIKPNFSVVIPSYNEGKNTVLLVDELRRVLSSLGTWELIFVDDGSSDTTLSTLRNLNKNDKRIRYTSFSRNFGHQNALRAGMERAQGECIISMDGDLQHPPEVIRILIEKFQEGYDIVNTLRAPDPNLGYFKRLSSQIFYRFINMLSDIKINSGAADFRLISRRALNALLALPEQNAFWRGLVPWIGFKQCSVPYMPAPRIHGKSKYSLIKMLDFAIDGITSFSLKPLQLTTVAGFFVSAIGFFYATYALYMHFFTKNTMPGWASILISILFIGGIQLISIGILGEYIGKLFMQSKGRPHYIIAEESEIYKIQSLDEHKAA